RRRHTRFSRDWSSDVCSSDLVKGNKHYLLSLEDSCQGMEFDTRFGVIQQEENQLNVNDKIVRLSDKKSQCSITSIYKLYPVQFEIGRASCRERVEIREGRDVW